MKCKSDDPGLSFTSPVWGPKQTTLPEGAFPLSVFPQFLWGNMPPYFSKFLSEWNEIIKNIKTWTLLSFVSVDMSSLCCDFRSAEGKYTNAYLNVFFSSLSKVWRYFPLHCPISIIQGLIWQITLIPGKDCSHRRLCSLSVVRKQEHKTLSGFGCQEI